MTIVLIGSGAREHALAQAVCRREDVRLICVSPTTNPGIKALSDTYLHGTITDVDQIGQLLLPYHPDLVIIGPEAPLEAGLADHLRSLGMPVFGPDRSNAAIESSKMFAREVIASCLPEANPECRSVSTLEEAMQIIRRLGPEGYVIKADGLMGGKGVKVAGEHLKDESEAADYIRQLLATDGTCLIEERLIGQEFSLMSITDGTTCLHLPAVQDHKRAYEGDTGPNTGGMGSYSDLDHSLPFLSQEEILIARRYNEQVLQTLQKRTGERYRGVLYGGFMVCRDSVKLIEYNARFGDPEVMNLMTLLQGDVASLLHSAATGDLDTSKVTLAPVATVCKYVVPIGYPQESVKGLEIGLGEQMADVCIYYGSVDLTEEGRLVTAGSRSAAVVATGNSLEEAETKAEQAIGQFTGRLFHRKDIGTRELIESRVAFMKDLRS